MRRTTPAKEQARPQRRSSLRERIDLVGKAVAAGSVLFAIGYLMLASQLRFGEPTRPGPAIWPLVAGGFFLLTSVALLFERSADKTVAADEEGDVPTGGDQPGNRSRMVIGVVGFTMYAFLLPRLGHLLAGLCMSAVVAWGAGKPNWWKALLIGIGVTVGVYVLISIVLGVRLPVGVLGVLA